MKISLRNGDPLVLLCVDFHARILEATGRKINDEAIDDNICAALNYSTCISSPAILRASRDVSSFLIPLLIQLC